LSAIDDSGRRRVLVLLLLVCGAPVQAHADWLFSPFLGRTFAGTTALPDLEEGTASAQTIYGGSVGWWTPGVLGVEADFAYVPGFFEPDSASGLVVGSNVVTFGLDLVVATPVSVTRESLRPYLVGGIGWMHASIDESLNLFPEFFGRAQNSIGMNVGGGAVGFLTQRTGVRFEVRQFRSLERDVNPFTTGERTALLSFWRATVGVVIRR